MAPRTADLQSVDERNWHLWHTIYFAPEDPRVLVPKWNDRPVGRTLNFARGQSYVILAMLLAAPVVIWGAIVIWQ